MVWFELILSIVTCFTAFINMSTTTTTIYCTAKLYSSMNPAITAKYKTQVSNSVKSHFHLNIRKYLFCSQCYSFICSTVVKERKWIHKNYFVGQAVTDLSCFFQQTTLKYKCLYICQWFNAKSDFLNLNLEATGIFNFLRLWWLW